MEYEMSGYTSEVLREGNLVIASAMPPHDKYTLLAELEYLGYERISTRIDAIWFDSDVTRSYLNELMFDERLGRNGFPHNVMQILFKLASLLPPIKQNAWSETRRDN